MELKATIPAFGRLAIVALLVAALAVCFSPATAQAANLSTNASKAAAASKSTAKKATKASKKKTPAITYRAHVQGKGWQSWKSNGKVVGTKKNLRLEAFRVKLSGVSGNVEYRARVQKSGWESKWRSKGKVSGTVGKGKRIEAVQMRLTGAAQKKFDVYYRVYCQKYGWLGWARNGASAGTQGLAKRVQALQVKLVKKGGKAPGSTNKAFRNKAGYVTGVPTSESFVLYRAHVQDKGWRNYVRDGQTAGTTGKKLRAEALNIKLGGAVSGGIKYRALVQDREWETTAWKKNGQTTGTTGKGLRIEALQIQLTGQAAQAYDVYYRTYVNGIGWMGWAANGERAGTQGYKKRLEALQVRLVPKGGAAPGNTANAFKRRGSALGDKIAAIAVAEYNSGVADGTYHYRGQKYWSRFKKKYEAWCSEFAGWCMVEAGLVPGVNMPGNPTYANSYLNFYRAHPELATVHVNNGTYEPQRGDIVLCVDKNGTPSHTELVVVACNGGAYSDVSGNINGSKVGWRDRWLPDVGVGYYISLKDV